MITRRTAGAAAIASAAGGAGSLVDNVCAGSRWGLNGLARAELGATAGLRVLEMADAAALALIIMLTKLAS